MLILAPLLWLFQKFFPQNESPFFIYLAYTAIGGPNQAPDKYLQKCKVSDRSLSRVRACVRACMVEQFLSVYPVFNLVLLVLTSILNKLCLLVLWYFMFSVHVSVAH